MFEEAAAFTFSGWNGDADAIRAWKCAGGQQLRDAGAAAYTHTRARTHHCGGGEGR